MGLQTVGHDWASNIHFFFPPETQDAWFHLCLYICFGNRENKQTKQINRYLWNLVTITKLLSFPGGSVDKESAGNAGDTRDVGSVPGSRRFLGGKHGNPLQYSCLGNPRDRGAWWATVHKVAKCQTRLKRLSTQHSKLLPAVHSLSCTFLPSGHHNLLTKKKKYICSL